MDVLDGEESKATHSDEGCNRPDRGEVLSYLSDLPALYAGASPETQQQLVRALFDRVEALGPSQVWLTPSVEAKANGWDVAMTGDFRATAESRSGRGERDSPATNDLPITMRLSEPPQPCGLLRSA